MIEVLRSGVNTWDCDQMGHLNVRHYFGRANHGLVTLALHLGLTPSRMRAQGFMLRARDQHVRFMRELRPGVYYAMSAGVLKATPERLHVYEQMDITHKGEAAASVLSELALYDVASGREVAFPEDVVARASAQLVQVPAELGPRGIERVAPRSPAPTRQEALDRGMYGAYLGPVLPEDCDAHGAMTEAAFMARVSDGIGHYFQKLRGPRMENIGGAALEYRYVFHERPRLGDVIEVRSALKAIGNKTNHICHWIFDVETGRCAATSEAIAVSFDLIARKAIAIPDDLRPLLESKIIPGLSV